MPTGHQGRKPCSNRCPRNSRTKIKQNTQWNRLSNQSKEKDIECNLRLKISTEPEETIHHKIINVHITYKLLQWHSHRGTGGMRPPTCPKDRLWDLSRSDEKLVRLRGTTQCLWIILGFLAAT